MHLAECLKDEPDLLAAGHEHEYLGLQVRFDK
jgi:hypothetical protein